MNAQEELTKLFMEGYDRGVEDAKQAAIEGIQKAILLEREACAKVVTANAHMFATPQAAESLAKAIQARGST